MMALFMASLAGQIYFGWLFHNEERLKEGLEPFSSWLAYVSSGHFLSALSENMESEFLQMGLFVLLTVYFIQKGSAESRPPEEEISSQERHKKKAEQVYSESKRKKYPYLWVIYEYSLTLTLLLLFIAFLILHGLGTLEVINEERTLFGEMPFSFYEVFFQPQFWFESFQNWQSEFFSIAALGVLSIFLRQKDSPQSKGLRESLWKTGSS